MSLNNSTFDQHFVNKNSQKHNKNFELETFTTTNNTDIHNTNSSSIRDNNIETR